MMVRFSLTFCQKSLRSRAELPPQKKDRLQVFLLVESTEIKTAIMWFTSFLSLMLRFVIMNCNTIADWLAIGYDSVGNILMLHSYVNNTASIHSIYCLQLEASISALSLIVS